jgi:Fur family ferric uptake transcriptional regulator
MPPHSCKHIGNPVRGNTQTNPESLPSAKELQLRLHTDVKLLLLSYYKTLINTMKEDIDNKLNLKNIKPTAMRQLVLEVLTEQKTAISLHELELIFEKADKVTLYRTLKTFEENKLIHSIDDGTGSVKYALCTETCQCNPQDLHVHFFCTQCQHTYCLNDIPVPSVNLPVHFTLENISMVVKGICSNCTV